MLTITLKNILKVILQLFIYMKMSIQELMDVNLENLQEKTIDELSSLMDEYSRVIHYKSDKYNEVKEHFSKIFNVLLETLAIKRKIKYVTKSIIIRIKKNEEKNSKKNIIQQKRLYVIFVKVDILLVTRQIISEQRSMKKRWKIKSSYNHYTFLSVYK